VVLQYYTICISICSFFYPIKKRSKKQQQQAVFGRFPLYCISNPPGENGRFSSFDGATVSQNLDPDLLVWT
jgi:hypothetical protein